MIIRCKINCSHIDKAALFKGEKGTYLDLTLLENTGGPDKYGNDFMVVQDIGKERREKGEKGPILGNGKKVDVAPPARAQPVDRTGKAVVVPLVQSRDLLGKQIDDGSEIPF